MVDHKCASCHTHSAAQMCNNTSCISGVVSPSPAPVLPYLDPSIHLCLQIIITMCEPSVVGQTSNERYLPNGFGETLPSAERLSEKSVMRLSQQMLLEGGRGGGGGGGPACTHHPVSLRSHSPFTHICSVWSSPPSSSFYPALYPFLPSPN